MDKTPWKFEPHKITPPYGSRKILRTISFAVFADFTATLEINFLKSHCIRMQQAICGTFALYGRSKSHHIKCINHDLLLKNTLCKW